MRKNAIVGKTGRPAEVELLLGEVEESSPNDRDNQSSAQIINRKITKEPCVFTAGIVRGRPDLMGPPPSYETAVKFQKNVPL